MFFSKTGSIALRLAEVQPPKTVATLSTEISFWAFSANVGQSEAPSSTTGSSFFPSTPPAALISSMAMSSEFFTVTSLMAIVPLSEWRMPTLMVSPLTPGPAAGVPPSAAVVSADPDSSALLPHAAARSESMATTATNPALVLSLLTSPSWIPECCRRAD